MKRKAERPPQPVPEPRAVKVRPRDYQPSKAELEEEIDMPGMSVKRMREAFFRPFRFESSE